MIALVIVFWGVRPERMVEVITNAKFLYLIPMEVALIIGLIARSNSWRILLGQNFKLRKVFDVVNVGYLINTVMPLRLGELGRAQIISSGGSTSIARVLGTIMIERLLDTLISLSALLISLPMIIIPNWAENLTWVVGISAIGVLVFSFILLTKKNSVLTLVERFSRIGLDRLRVITEDFIAGLESLLQPTRILSAGSWSLLAWICVWVQMWLLLASLDAPASLAAFLFVPSVVAFGSALPPSPGALGVFEIAAVAGLLVFGIERETALSVAILWHGLQLLTTAVFGGWGLAREGRSLLDLAERAQSMLRNRSASNAT